jgi:uncharacterized protein (TIGR03382 family)
VTHVEVHALPTVSILATGPLDLGQFLGLQAVVSNGTGPFGYVWQGLPGGCIPGFGPDFQCLPTALGATAVAAVVTDAAGISSESSAVGVTVYPVVAGTVRLAPAVIDLGQTATVTVALTGGAPPVSASFTGLPPGCPSTGLLQFSCTPAGGQGTFEVRAVLHDGAGETATTSPFAWTVNATLSAVLWSAGSEVTVGDNLSLRALLTGGSAPFTYTYSGLPSGCAASDGPAIDCVPTSAGSFDVRVAVGDAAHANASSNLTVTVDPLPPTPAPAAGLSSVGEYGGVGAVVLLAIVAVAWVLRRRRTPSVEPTDSDEPV